MCFKVHTNNIKFKTKALLFIKMYHFIVLHLANIYIPHEAYKLYPWVIYNGYNRHTLGS